MADSQNQAASHPIDGTPQTSSTDTPERLNVMQRHVDEACASTGKGCTDRPHPEMPYWHPLNGPFPSD